MARIGSLVTRGAALVLLAGAAVLAVLQARWVTAASREEEGRLRMALAQDLSRVRRDAEDEIRILMSLLYVSPEDFQSRDWQGITESTALWYRSSLVPDLLREVYVIPDQGAGIGFAYSREKERFVAAPLPQEIAVGAHAVEGPVAGGRPDGSGANGYMFIPVLAQPSGEDSGGTAGAVVLRIDRTALYTHIVPRLVERHLPGFPYRVRSLKPEEVLLSSGSIPAAERPEATLLLSGLPLTEARWAPSVRVSGGGATGEGKADDALLRYWLMRLKGERESPTQDPVAEAGPVTVVLEVFYPGRSIATVVRAGRILNMAVGGGILTVLVLGALALYRLYRTSARLRVSEQEFVATVSHELRTPVSVIQAASENLRRGVVSEPHRVSRYGGVINEQARRLAGMVEAILFYSGLQSGRERTPAWAPVHLASFLEDTLRPLRSFAAERSKDIVALVEDTSREILSDGTALRLIVENLVMNAIRHADPGQIRVSVRFGSPPCLLLAVEDDGPGIPPREQARVFERFARGERSTVEQHPGSGLGLHLARRVAGILGGEVSLTCPYANALGDRNPGCRFTVSLPLHVANHG
jgi:signal transduction histidine kinase